MNVPASVRENDLHGLFAAHGSKSHEIAAAVDLESPYLLVTAVAAVTATK